MKPEAVYKNFPGGRILPYDRLHDAVKKDFIQPHEFNSVIVVKETTYGKLPLNHQFVPFPEAECPCILLGPATIYEKYDTAMYGAKLIDPQCTGLKDFPKDARVIDLKKFFSPELVTRITLSGTHIYTDD